MKTCVATIEINTNTHINFFPIEEEKIESNQEVANIKHHIKYPLHNRWTLWFSKNDQSETWQTNLLLIFKSDTLKDFGLITILPSNLITS
uniref:Uncharacterized protein n=1 Tax=Peromyscus maniculatus bairdii TaxID=230844 RepID=A0A8C8UPN6_PERMB